MCGILTVCDARGVDQDRLINARDCMRHRGPDFGGHELLREGRIALAHRRLSILDLTPAGHQPMQLEGLHIVFNGEIYNYPELRRELEGLGCAFRSRSDTEVLLHGYKVWGARVCERLQGMFAFAIWNDVEERLFAARDHFGQKPLYYSQRGAALVLASEIKAIRAYLGGDFVWRKASLPEFLLYDYVPEPFTWYEEVLALLPGHTLEFRPFVPTQKPAMAPFWSFMPQPEPLAIAREEAIEELRARLKGSVRRHLLADVEVGALLSGGLDSSTVAAFAAPATAGQLKTFSIGFGSPDGDELPFAGAVARFIKSQHREKVVSREDLIAAAERSLELFDQPFGDNSQMPTFEVARLAAAELKVVLTGDGGDEVFGGYYQYAKYLRLPPFQFTGIRSAVKAFQTRWRGFEHWQASLHVEHLMRTEDSTLALLGPELGLEFRDYDLLWFLKQHHRAELDPFRRAQWLDLKTYLPSVLTKVDRCTMRHSLEARCPLLDHTLVEWIFSLPREVTNPSGGYKTLLKEAMTGIIPGDVLQRPKQGFNVTTGLLAEVQKRGQTNGRLQQLISNGILSKNAALAMNESKRLAWQINLIGAVLGV